MINKLWKWVVLLGVVLFIALPFLGKKEALHLSAFKSIPVLHQGRYKPLDTVARQTLLSLRGKQTIRVDKKNISAMEWLETLVFDPKKADAWPVFRIEDPSIISQFNKVSGKDHYLSFNELKPNLDWLQSQAQLFEKIESSQRNGFQRNVLLLRNQVLSYFQLKHLVAVESDPDFYTRASQYLNNLPAIRPLIEAHQSQTTLTEDQKNLLEHSLVDFRVFSFLVQSSAVQWVAQPDSKKADFLNMGDALLLSLKTSALEPGLNHILALKVAYDAKQWETFEKHANAIKAIAYQTKPQLSFKIKCELFLNHLEPFYISMCLYVFAFLGLCLAWVFQKDEGVKAAFWTVFVAFLIHTIGILMRMYIQGRPPVTNLYTSAVFVGWGAIILGLILERFSKKGLGTLVCTVMGFLSLIVAHHLALQGDTLEMMQAVLDSNFWLSTHVVTVTIGYSATFLAGFLAHIYILGGVFNKKMSESTLTELSKMTYAIICFALFFSFTGTVLGGIWADQSWGRFWGWDPKENGALLICLWNAIILHARLAGKVKARGLIVMAILGNIITAFSWFGVNMLGVGLHSYGFMEKAFFWLVLFIFSQLFVAWVGLLPLRYWKALKKES